MTRGKYLTNLRNGNAIAITFFYKYKGFDKTEVALNLQGFIGNKLSIHSSFFFTKSL